jgi:hypothetical protein
MQKNETSTQPVIISSGFSKETLKKSGTTKVVIKYDCGFGNTLYIRGKGANLSWDKGHPITNTNKDEWTWESATPFQTCEFKVLINDHAYEQGHNHILACGSSFQYTPAF